LYYSHYCLTSDAQYSIIDIYIIIILSYSFIGLIHKFMILFHVSVDFTYILHSCYLLLVCIS